MVERRSGDPESELRVAAARFTRRFQAAVHGKVEGIRGVGEPVITEDRAPGHRISYKAGGQLVQIVFAHPEPGHGDKTPFEYTHIQDVSDNPGSGIASISMRAFPTGHFELSAIAPAQIASPDDEDGNKVFVSIADLSVKISSASLIDPKTLSKRLSDGRLVRAFEHFGIPPQILTGVPTT